LLALIRRCPFYLAALAPAFLCPSGAQAQAPVAFNIPRTSLSAAITQAAVQAKVSISTRALSQCPGEAGPLVGRFNTRAALQQLLAGSGCGIRMLDASTFEIVRVAPPQRPPPRVAPVPVAERGVAELVVVATRRPTPASQLAYSISRVGASALTAMGVRDAADLALITPAMTSTNLGPGRDKILLRGLSDGPLTGRTQSMVGLYLDDVRLTYNAPDPDLRLVDMDRVEVLRGPQGALYGSGSLGGVVRMSSAPPDRDQRAGWIGVSGGLTRGGAASNAVEGMLNLPIASSHGAARLVAYREVQGGYVDDPRRSAADTNTSVRTGGRLTASLTLSPAWTVAAGGVLQRINTADSQYALVDAPRYTRANRVAEPHDNDFSEAHLTLSGDFGWGDLHTSAALVRHEVSSRYDASAVGGRTYDDINETSSLLSETTLASKPLARTPWLAGLFLADSRQDITLRLAADAPSPIAFEEARRDRIKEAALYGQISAPLTPTLALTVGGRLFATTSKVMSTVRPSAAPIAYAGHADDSGFAPKVVLSFQPRPTILLYAQASEGYRAGGLNTTAAARQPFGDAVGLARAYRSDELWSYEGGTRLSLLDDALVVRTAAFLASWRHVQSDQLLPSGLPYAGNIGDARNLGLEFEAAYRSGPLALSGEFVVNDPELTRRAGAAPELGLAAAPKVSGGLMARYVWQLPLGAALALDGRYAYVGKSRLTAGPEAGSKMGGYGVGRVSVSLDADRWRLDLALDNPFNVRGDSFAYGNPFAFRQTPQTTPLRPRTAMLRIESRF
jgi:outer membrane receptor protein involved in Fe transport